MPSVQKPIYSVSLLTSSSSKHLSELRDEFAGEVGSLELYTLREPDLVDLGLETQRSEARNLVDIIGGASPEDMKAWAAVLKDRLGIGEAEPEPGALLPLGLATFVPQLASRYRHEDAVGALKNILVLAAEMGVRCVELVCGKVSEHCPEVVETGAGTPEECEAIFYESRTKKKRPRIIHGLRKLRDFVRDELRKPVAIALEVEPGPLYVLKNLRIAADFLELTGGEAWVLGKGADKYHFVGMNMDIGHLLICHENRLEAWKRIPPQRVYNFHISDNAELHFADLIPGTIHSISPHAQSCHPRVAGSFADWLRCFLCLCESRPNPIFTSNVSVELEACASPQWAHQAIRNTRFLLRRLETQGNPRGGDCKGCPLYADGSRQ